MPSMAHGRNYNGPGAKRGVGPNVGKKATAFSCESPAGGRFVKRVFNAGGFKSPVSLWYEHNGEWYLNTVVDKEDLPDWAANYKQMPAKPVKRI